MDATTVDRAKITQVLADFAVRSAPTTSPPGLCGSGPLVPQLDRLRGRRLDPPDHRSCARGDQAVRRPGPGSVLGRGDKLDLLHAALVNGISSHVFDFDDTHLKTIIHPAGPIASALLPLAETPDERPRLPARLHPRRRGRVPHRQCGLSEPLRRRLAHHRHGGVFGAAAAAGKVLGLDRQQMAWALGIAATQSSGLREMFGTMCKPFHPGRAAQNGLFAAHLAEQNFTSSDRGIEAPRGFAHVLSTKFDAGRDHHKLGETWEISLNTYKPFACGIVIHPAIDGCIQLRNAHGLKATDIASIALKCIRSCSS